MTWNFASINENIHAGRHYGYAIPENIGIDYAHFKNIRDATIKRLNGAYENNWNREGIDLVHGHARFVEPKTIEVSTGPDGSEKTRYTAKHILIAVGGHPIIPKNVQGAEPATMLRALNRISVVTHAPSDNLCRHQGRDPADCARDRSAGLLAHEVAAAGVPGAVRSGTSLKLVDGGGRVLERVPDVASLDVRALLAQLVGSVQALRAENEAQAGEIAELKKTVALLS